MNINAMEIEHPNTPRLSVMQDIPLSAIQGSFTTSRNNLNGQFRRGIPVHARGRKHPLDLG